MNAHRWVAAFLLLMSIWYGSTATSFSSSSLDDPLGPRVFPFVLAGILGLCSVWLFFQPYKESTWSGRSFLLKAGSIVLCLVGYALCLEWLGFVVTTSLVMFALAMIFKGPWGWSLAGSIFFSLAMYALFVFALGLRLPMGVWVG